MLKLQQDARSQTRSLDIQVNQVAEFGKQEIDQAQSAELNALFARLSASTSAAEAQGIADAIWVIWTQPDDPVLAARVAEIITAGGLAGPMSQMALIDQLIADYPDYSEGWNMRATAHFLRGAYEESLADIEKTLALEPRHFGALSGLGLSNLKLGRDEAAADAFRRLLSIDPLYPNAKRNLKMAQDALARNSI